MSSTTAIGDGDGDGQQSNANENGQKRPAKKRLSYKGEQIRVYDKAVVLCGCLNLGQASGALTSQNRRVVMTLSFCTLLALNYPMQQQTQRGGPVGAI